MKITCKIKNFTLNDWDFPITSARSEKSYNQLSGSYILI